MKIKELSMAGFGSYLNTKIQFNNPVAIVMGEMASGKSTIKQAIEFALLDSCEGLRKRTDPKNSLINVTRERTEVLITLEDGMKIARSRSLKSSPAAAINGKTQKKDVADTKILEHLDTTETLLQIAFNGHEFFDLSPVEQRALILSILPQKLEPDHALTVAEVLKDGYEHQDVTTISDFDEAMAYFYSLRTEVKRDMNAIKSTPHPEGDKPDLKVLKKKRDQIEKDLLATKEELGGARASADMRQRVQDKLDELLFKRVELENKINDLDLEIKKQEPENAKLQKQLKNGKKKQDDLAEQNLQAQADRAGFKKAIALLSEFDGMCIAGSHPCPASAEAMKDALKDQEAALEENGKALESLREEMKVVNRAVADLERKLASFPVKQEKLVQLRAFLDQKDEEIQKTREELGKMGEAPEAVVDREALLTKRLSEARREVTEAEEWLRQAEESKESAVKYGELTARHERLDNLVTFFGPKGFRVTVMEERIEAFVNQLNELMEAFGYVVTISLEPWEITVQDLRSEDESGPVEKRASNSEHFRLGAAIQVALAKWSGLNFAIIDNAELLDLKARDSLVEMAQSAGLDQAIIIWTTVKPLHWEAFLKWAQTTKGKDLFLVSKTFKDGVGVSEVLAADEDAYQMLAALGK